MYSLIVMVSSIKPKIFASLYIGVPMADKLVLKDGRSSVKFLWTSLGHTQIGPLLLNGDHFLSQRFLRTSLLFFIWIR